MRSGGANKLYEPKTPFYGILSFGKDLVQILEEAGPKGIRALKKGPSGHDYIGEYLSVMADHAWKVNPKATEKALKNLSMNLNLVDGSNPLREISQIENTISDACEAYSDSDPAKYRETCQIANAQRKLLDKLHTPIISSLYCPSDIRDKFDKQLALTAETV